MTPTRVRVPVAMAIRINENGYGSQKQALLVGLDKALTLEPLTVGKASLLPKPFEGSVNISFDDEIAKKVQDLMGKTGLKKSAIVRSALHLFIMMNNVQVEKVED